MRIAVLGTGRVGQTIGTRLVELGHEVRMGSRSPDNEALVSWAREAGERASGGTFADAAHFGELIFNCTSGAGSIDALKAAGEENLADKVLIDVSNPLDHSGGMPPSLFVSNTDSLAEQIQAAFPGLKVVKALNTMNCDVMVRPEIVPGDHVAFVSGNDAEAKRTTTQLLGEFGWPEDRVIDLGDITTARGPEMYLALWLRLMGQLKTPLFNITIAN